MDWDDIRYFLAVSRTGSIRGAAAKLGVNHSTVSRRISQLEQQLGVRLFDKLPSGYVITPAGEEIVSFAHQMEEQTSALERKVFGRDTALSGDLRVTLPEALATHLLMRDFEKFAQTYPGINIELVISDEEFSLSKREADVAIRVTNGSPPEHLVGRRLLAYYRCIYASREYMTTHDVINQPETLRWIGWDDSMQLPQWVKTSEFPKSPIQHQVNHVLTQFAAAKAGLGISMLPCFLGDPEPSLQRLPGAMVQQSRDIWLLTHRDLRQTARVRAFTEFMADAIRSYQALLQGETVNDF